MKKYLLMTILTAALMLGACSVGKDDKKENKEADVVLDSELISVEYRGSFLDNADGGKEGKITFDIKNKTDQKILVQQSGLKIGGYAVDPGIVSFGTEIDAGEKETGVELTVNEYEGFDFPEFKGDVELKIVVVDTDTYADIEGKSVNFGLTE